MVVLLLKVPGLRSTVCESGSVDLWRTPATKLNATAGSLPPTTPLSPSAVSAQSLVMSSSAVGAEASVTLTLADTQGLLSGGLDTVTLNIASQGQQFPALLTDPSLSGPGGAGSPQVILVSPPAQPSSACEEITYQVTDVSTSLGPGGAPEKEARLHVCLECGCSFTSAGQLLQHSKAAHGRERIHVCPVCRKAFKRATHLKEHMQTHQAGPSLSSQKPRVFKCDTCEKAFAKPSQLERHSRIHTGERPFPCTLCEKAFNQKSALQVHMKKHTGERPYRCDYCVMGFTQKSNMKLHMKRAHSYAGEAAPCSQQRPGHCVPRAGELLWGQSWPSLRPVVPQTGDLVPTVTRQRWCWQRGGISVGPCCVPPVRLIPRHLRVPGSSGRWAWWPVAWWGFAGRGWTIACVSGSGAVARHAVRPECRGEYPRVSRSHRAGPFVLGSFGGRENPS
uniref:Zinc finger protein 236 n=1 Tax=Moschus moschiferus TaxID=68415 RepID=A0A8C6D9X4_MOSMO